MYSSIAAQDLDQGALFEIISTSAANNAVCDLGGFLIYRSGCFLQLLEGPEEKLGQLVETISQDPRHHSVNVLYENKITARSFPAWNMKRIGIQDRAAALAYVAEQHTGPLPPKVRRIVSEFFDSARE